MVPHQKVLVMLYNSKLGLVVECQCTQCWRRKHGETLWHYPLLLFIQNITVSPEPMVRDGQSMQSAHNWSYVAHTGFMSTTAAS